MFDENLMRSPILPPPAPPKLKKQRPRSVVLGLLGFMFAAGVAVFLIACVYAGYVSELLKDAIGDIPRATLMIGFIIGAGVSSKYLSSHAMKAYRKAARERRR